MNCLSMFSPAVAWFHAPMATSSIPFLTRVMEQPPTFFSVLHSTLHSAARGIQTTSCQSKAYRTPPVKSEVKVLVAQSCWTLCDPMGYRLPGSSVHRILQARMLNMLPDNSRVQKYLKPCRRERAKSGLQSLWPTWALLSGDFIKGGPSSAWRQKRATHTLEFRTTHRENRAPTAGAWGCPLAHVWGRPEVPGSVRVPRGPLPPGNLWPKVCLEDSAWP